ncbi:GlcNAc transferase [Pelomyxa schiedti]|nr:GlcNAc transferase [Pelomyxa schiedti]
MSHVESDASAREPGASGTTSDTVCSSGGSGAGLRHRRYKIAMVSDFFYPNVGGVEVHQYQLAHHLISRGHKVIICTHFYGNRLGVRYLSNGAKVYYLPLPSMYNQCTFPSLYTDLPLIRHILIREGIEVVHCHQAFSSLSYEFILHGRAMHLPVVFTDHSLFGFKDASSIIMNKILELSLWDISHVICVSHTSKENTILRAQIHPDLVSVIPNAIDTSQFMPDPSARDPSKVTIVILSRLVYRKGIDLVIDVIPLICKKYSNAHFLIGGDGPKRLAIEEMREKYQLQDRVTLLGEVGHCDVRNVLIQGDIFFNSSLTEAFCIAILEAASCGLFVVSTKVGGVPEVLPQHMIKYAEPNTQDIAVKLSEAIELKKPSPYLMHEQVRLMYSWCDIAARTEIVYDRVMNLPKLTLMQRLSKIHTLGFVLGKVLVLVITVEFLLMLLVEFLVPAHTIERVPEYHRQPTITHKCPPPPRQPNWKKEPQRNE